MPKIRKASRHFAFATAVAIAWTGQNSHANDAFLDFISQIPAAEESAGKTVTHEPSAANQVRPARDAGSPHDADQLRRGRGEGRNRGKR